MSHAWNWIVASGAESLAASLIGREDDWFAGAKPLKENSARRLFATGEFFVKHYKSRPDQAESEWAALYHLSKAGLPVPRPVAWSRAPGDSAVLVLTRLDAEPLKDRFARRLLPAVADLLRRMHRAGFLHLDLHVGNILVSRDGLHIIDVHRGRIRPVSGRDEERAVGQFAYSVSRVGTRSDVVRFVRLYREARDREWAHRVLLHADAFRRRHLASRTRRCLRSSTGFETHRESEGLWFLRRPFSMEQARAALAAHDALRQSRKALKDLGGRAVTVAGGIVLKEWTTGGPFRALRNWVRGTPARAAWIGDNGLRVRSLPCPEPLFLLESRGRSVFASRQHPGVPLDRLCREQFPTLRDRRPFLDALATLVARLHRSETHHRDLKANNILADGPTRFAFLDLEDVSFRRVTRPQSIRALAQLNAALPVLTRTDRWRMLKRYVAGYRVLGDLKAAAREIWKATVARKHNYPPRRG